jgi:hypothetical protein
MNQPPLFVIKSGGDDIEDFRRRLIEELQSMKVEADTPLIGWWTQHNDTLNTVIKAVKRFDKVEQSTPKM